MVYWFCWFGLCIVTGGLFGGLLRLVWLVILGGDCLLVIWLVACLFGWIVINSVVYNLN